MARNDQDALRERDAQVRRARVYDSPSSKARREEERRGPAKPGIGARQVDERAEMAQRHRNESRELAERQRKQRDRYHPEAGHGHPPADMEKRHKAERDKLNAKQQRERVAMQDRHRVERVAAAEKAEAKPAR